MRITLVAILLASTLVVAQQPEAPVQGTVDSSGVAKVGLPTPEDQIRALQRERLLLNIKVIEAEACAASLDCAQAKLSILKQLEQLKPNDAR